METRKINVNEIVPNEGQIEGLPSNPRSWNRSDISRLKKSIEETPELLEARGIIVYPHDGRYIVMGGNMRLEAVKSLKMKEVSCIVLPENTPVSKLKEIVIKDNGSFGNWDDELLSKDWGDLPLGDWGIPSWEDKSTKKKEAKEDDFDEDTDEVQTRCKLGDIWQLGDHRLMCGDSTDLQSVTALMGGSFADLLLTDPPYNISYKGRTSDHLKIQNDSMKDEDFLNFLRAAFKTASEVMKQGASFYIWHADSEVSNFRNACVSVGWKVRQCLIWNKNSLIMGRQDYQWKHEPCLYGWKDGASHNWFSDRKQTTVMNFDRPLRNAEHPTMKPVQLFGYQMSNSTKEGDIVLDLFGGSGTTIVAAEQLGRKAYLMELDPHYCDVIIARWEKLTGKEGIKI